MSATKRFTVHERAPQRHYTTDSARERSRDTLLSAEVLAKNPQALGRVWLGEVTSILDLIGPRAAADALAEIQRGLSKYGQSLGSSDGAPARAEREFALDGKATTPQKMNDDNKKYWADRLEKPLTKDHSGPGLSTRATPQSIMDAAAGFWAGRKSEQDSLAWLKPWGGGR